MEARGERVGGASRGYADSFPRRLMCRTEKIFRRLQGPYVIGLSKNRRFIDCYERGFEEGEMCGLGQMVARGERETESRVIVSSWRSLLHALQQWSNQSVADLGLRERRSLNEWTLARLE